MQPLHIAFLLTQSLESPSGLGRYGPLARGLAKRGRQVEIFALHPNFSKSIAQPMDQDGVRVTYVAPMHVRKDGNQKTYYKPLDLLKVTALASWRLSLSAFQTRAQVLHVCKPHPMNGIAGVGAAWLRQKSLFVDCDDYEAGSNLFGAAWQKAIVAGFERNVPRRARAVTTNTHFMMQKLLEWGIESGRVGYLPNGVEPARFKPPTPEQVQALRTRLGLGGKRVIAYIGSLSLTNHPVNLLLEAFGLVRSALADATLLIAGGGEDYEALKNQATNLGFGEAVLFTGRIAPDEIVKFYHLADVSVDPVYDDDAARGRSPLKMFESWACGVPFVTADVGDRRELMGSPPAGILARPGDAPALADGILRMLQDRSTALELSARGLQQVQQFRWEVLAGDLEDFYLANQESAPHKPA